MRYKIKGVRQNKQLNSAIQIISAYLLMIETLHSISQMHSTLHGNEWIDFYIFHSKWETAYVPKKVIPFPELVPFPL